uniref:Metalloendopeptidase n=1 Tax=Haemonchus placei TaxID=6290 RepID=A0A0N4WUG7_HAEPC
LQVCGPSFLKIRDTFKRVEEKIVKTLRLTPELLKSLQERLKKWRPIKNDKVEEAGDSIEEINENSQVGEDLYQADMVLTVEQAEEIVEGIEEQDGKSRTKRQAFKDHRYPRMTWSEGVNFYFHESASKEVRSAFIKGAKLWEKDTCINFAENSSATDRIMVFPQQGCWSFVGKVGGEQNLSLGAGCESVATAAHEIGHALGLLHTMSRYDRDDYITLNTVNIKSPAGTVIQVRLKDFSTGLSVDGCKYAGVEIKTNKDQTLTGYRFCSPDAAGITLQSFTNRVPIMTYNRIYQSKTVLEYRYGTYSTPFRFKIIY